MVKCEGYELGKTQDYGTTRLESGAVIGISEGIYEVSTSTSSEWTRLEYKFNSGCRKEIRLALSCGRCYYGKCKGTAWFSDVKLEENQTELTNHWNILVMIYNNVDAPIEINGKKQQFKSSFSAADINDIVDMAKHLEYSFEDFSDGQMTASIDVFTCSDYVKKLAHTHETDYCADPYCDKVISNTLDKAIAEKKRNNEVYNAYIMITPLDALPEGIKGNWIGMSSGSWDYKGMLGCQARYEPGKIGHGPEGLREGVMLHEIVHCIERVSNKINPGQAPRFDDAESFGYKINADTMMMRYYRDYMCRRLAGGKGLDERAYMVYNSYKYKVKSNDMTIITEPEKPYTVNGITYDRVARKVSYYGNNPVSVEKLKSDFSKSGFNIGVIDKNYITISDTDIVKTGDMVRFAGETYGNTLTIIPKTDDKLPAPQNVKATLEGDTSVLITWDAVSGTDKYIVSWRPASKSEWKTAETTKNSMKLKNMSKGTKYYFKVTVYDMINGKLQKQSTSETISKVISKTVLAAPQNVTATAGSSYVTISWDEVKGADAYKVYQYSPSDNSWKEVKYTEKTTFSIYQLSPNTEYIFRVDSYDWVEGMFIFQNQSSAVKVRTKPN